MVGLLPGKGDTIAEVISFGNVSSRKRVILPGYRETKNIKGMRKIEKC